MIKKGKGAMVRTHGNQGFHKVHFLILILYTFVTANEVEIFSYVPEAKVLVSDTEIVAGNMIRIKIRANGDKVVFPNIEEIDGVPVLEQHEIIVNRPHYINGILKKERTILILTFAPHHDVTIPSYDVKIDGKMYKTKPVNIKVMPVNAQNTEDNNKFFLHLEVDKKSVIVGESILATIYLSLKNGIRLSTSPQYTAPLFKGFFSKVIGDEKVYAKGNRQITELKYMLTPQREGTFNVGPAKVKIGVPNQYRRDMFGRIVGTTWIPIVSDTVKVNVQKRVQESDLVGYFTMEHTLETHNVKANKPVKLTLKITGDGSLEDFELPDFEIDGVTVYSDDAKINIELNSTLHSTYSKSFVFIADRDFTIPARRISMYDPKNKTVGYLELPSYAIHVEGSQALMEQKPKEKLAYAGKVYHDLHTSQKSMLDIEEEQRLSKVQMLPWWMMLLAFLLGMLVMYLFRYLFPMPYRGKRKNINETEALKKLYAYTNESTEIETMVRKLYAKKNGDKTVFIDQIILKKLVEQYADTNAYNKK